MAIAISAACRGAPAAQADRLTLALTPASFGQTLSLQQQVHVETAGRTVDFDAALDIAPDSLTLVGMARRVPFRHASGGRGAPCE